MVDFWTSSVLSMESKLRRNRLSLIGFPFGRFSGMLPELLLLDNPPKSISKLSTLFLPPTSFRASEGFLLSLLAEPDWSFWLSSFTFGEGLLRTHSRMLDLIKVGLCWSPIRLTLFTGGISIWFGRELLREFGLLSVLSALGLLPSSLLRASSWASYSW